MLNTPKELLSILDELNIEYVNTEHPPVFTVEEADRHHEGIEGAHSKNLFFKDKKKRLFLVVTLADKPLRIKDVGKLIGANNMSFAKPDLLMEVLGMIPGAVTPFAAVNIKDREVKVVLDEELMEHALLNFHPLTNTATTTIASQDLVKFLEHVGQAPEIIRL
ncbi:MAG: prolyl-tRNA synthetase associated domain-containing protein [Desulfovibrionales bacterium]|nr:prolyl-tRNA synthetase associated domain-containing protein [Desulfovibrionales bacterium]